MQITLEPATPTAAGTLSRPLTHAWLTSRFFTFRAGPNQNLLASSLRFEPNARISGCRHSNETAWRIENDKLVILRSDGVPTCIATLVPNTDGTASLIGLFLLDNAGSVHRFDEMANHCGLPEVNTFDLFDTLVARRCGEPAAIFRLVENKSGLKGFASHRQNAERALLSTGNYNFADIYASLAAHTNWNEETLNNLRLLELTEEWDNLFPMHEMVARVRPNDMIISDMYLPMSFLRRVVDLKCGLSGQVLHLSSHGKHLGTIWPKLQKTHLIRRHHGDNPHSDVRSAKHFGIDAEHVTFSGWTRSEQILGDNGLADLAKLLREARLKTFDADPIVHRPQLAQLALNLPLLILASLDVLGKAREQEVDTLLMCARDCNLWVSLMHWMAQRSSAAPSVRYFVASRVLLLSDSPEYRAYFQRMRGTRSMLVDVSGTGRSPSHFIGWTGSQSHTSVVLLTAGIPHKSNFVDTLARPSGNVRVDAITHQSFPLRLAVESLNMSLEGRAMRVAFDGQSLEIGREQNEFGPLAQTAIHAMRSGFLSAMRVLRRSEIRRLPEALPAEQLQRAINDVIALAPSFFDVVNPIAKDINREEAYIASAAVAERDFATHRFAPQASCVAQ